MLDLSCIVNHGIITSTQTPQGKHCVQDITLFDLYFERLSIVYGVFPFAEEYAERNIEDFCKPRLE